MLRYAPLLLLLAPAFGCVGKQQIQRALAQTDLGAAYYREGNPEAAIEALRHAQELDPRNWRASNLLGIALLSKGLPEEAEVEFKRALRIDPTEAEILVNYGAMKLRQGDNDGAIEMFTKAMSDLDYRNVALVLSDLSLAYTEAGRLPEAVGAAREATRRAPTLCQGWFHLGLAEEKSGHPDEAVVAYGGLITNCPADSEGARVRIACIQAQGAEPELGRQSLRELADATRGTPLGDEARACLTGS
jgi:Flp pilus assembly protein TadD